MKLIQSCLFFRYMLLLPKVTPDGCRIMLYGINSEDPSLFRLDDFFHRMAMILDIQQKNGIDFMGLRVIIYLRFATLNHLTLFDLPYLKRVFKVARVSEFDNPTILHLIFCRKGNKKQKMKFLESILFINFPSFWRFL